MRWPFALVALALALAAAGMVAGGLCHVRTAAPGQPEQCGTSGFAVAIALAMVGASALAMATLQRRWPLGPALAALGIGAALWAMFAVTGFLWWTFTNLAVAALALAAGVLAPRPAGKHLAGAAATLFLLVNAGVGWMSLLGGTAVVLSAAVLLGLPMALLHQAWPTPVQEP
ncbi:MAG TPA: hypothetical protein VGR28_03820 [Candidatus Thermoplasmatota archaeon]|jgi:hypothetical protein|nr:hypothetical protein [Candidatus Thermoplasmatota archaeon]